jgi:hypothetical protein
MEMENSIFAVALPRKVPLTGEASKGSLEAATADRIRGSAETSSSLISLTMLE